jgi:hypothetical protein
LEDELEANIQYLGIVVDGSKLEVSDGPRSGATMHHLTTYLGMFQSPLGDDL